MLMLGSGRGGGVAWVGDENMIFVRRMFGNALLVGFSTRQERTCSTACVLDRVADLQERQAARSGGNWDSDEVCQ
jgi:hypothetical protein